MIFKKSDIEFSKTSGILKRIPSDFSVELVFELISSAVATSGVPVDTTGDGVADGVAIDTTGNGAIDTHAVDTTGDGKLDTHLPQTRTTTCPDCGETMEMPQASLHSPAIACTNCGVRVHCRQHESQRQKDSSEEAGRPSTGGSDAEARAESRAANYDGMYQTFASSTRLAFIQQENIRKYGKEKLGKSSARVIHLKGSGEGAGGDDDRGKGRGKVRGGRRGAARAQAAVPTGSDPARQAIMRRQQALYTQKQEQYAAKKKKREQQQQQQQQQQAKPLVKEHSSDNMATHKTRRNSLRKEQDVEAVEEDVEAVEEDEEEEEDDTFDDTYSVDSFDDDGREYDEEWNSLEVQFKDEDYDNDDSIDSFDDDSDNSEEAAAAEAEVVDVEKEELTGEAAMQAVQAQVLAEAAEAERLREDEYSPDSFDGDGYGYGDDMNMSDLEEPPRIGSGAGGASNAEQDRLNPSYIGSQRSFSADNGPSNRSTLTELRDSMLDRADGHLRSSSSSVLLARQTLSAGAKDVNPNPAAPEAPPRVVGKHHSTGTDSPGSIAVIAAEELRSGAKTEPNETMAGPGNNPVQGFM
jgi:hypothetical protein